MKQEKWKDIFERLEAGEISEEKAQEEILKNYGVPSPERMRQCS
ncbi:MAG: hypothetical protein ACXQTP_03335 [Candidatus Methanofastidiosia archaeon]